MNKTFLALLLVCGLSGPLFGEASQDLEPLTSGLAELRYKVTQIEAVSTNKVPEFIALAKQADSWVASNPGKPEPLIWKGIVLAARAKYVGISALALVDEARTLLDKAVSIDPSASDAAGLNALGILYHKAPCWPVSFGSNKKARAYFERALATSSNLDTHYRTGEFLLDLGEREAGISHLKTALAFPERPGRPEDVWKREAIQTLLRQNKSLK
jgi:tetratricopeptide (TPR) repeat protein